jgi:hypothetical protein
MNFSNLKFTTGERKFIDWCYGTLDPDEIAQIEEEAVDLAVEEMSSSDAERLRSMLVHAIVRNAIERGEL